MTSSQTSGRVMGIGKSFTGENQATVFITGNRAQGSADAGERFLLVSLHMKEVDNRDRIIPKIIDEHWLMEKGNRTQILSAMWTIVRAWVAAGKPLPPTFFPRYHAWSCVVPAIVAFARFGDPCAPPDDVTLNKELQDIRALMGKLAPRDSDDRIDLTAPPQRFEFTDIIKQVTAHGLFDDVEVRKGRNREDMFNEEGTELSPAGRSYFGKLLAHYRDRVFLVEGHKIHFTSNGRGRAKHFVVTVQP